MKQLDIYDLQSIANVRLPDEVNYTGEHYSK